jgi:hypothetical protein
MIYQRLEGGILKKAFTIFLDFGETSNRICYPHIKGYHENISTSKQQATNIPKLETADSIPVLITGIQDFFSYLEELQHNSDPRSASASESSHIHKFMLIRTRVLRILIYLLRETVFCFKATGKENFDYSQYVVRTCNSMLKSNPKSKENPRVLLKFLREFADSQHFTNWVSVATKYLQSKQRADFARAKCTPDSPHHTELKQQQICLLDDLLGAYGFAESEVQFDEESPELASTISTADFSLHYFDGVNMVEIESILGYNSTVSDHYSGYTNLSFKSTDLLPEYLTYRGLHFLHEERVCTVDDPKDRGSSHLFEWFEKSSYYQPFIKSIWEETGHRIESDGLSQAFVMKKSIDPSAVYDLRLMCELQLSSKISSFLKKHPFQQSALPHDESDLVHLEQQDLIEHDQDQSMLGSII